MKRRRFVAMPAAPGAARLSWAERLGVVCQLGSTEAGARKVIEAAAQAGFKRVQVNFAWDCVDAGSLKGVPRWLSAAGLKCETLGAYVNSLAPAVNLMRTREEDFIVRFIERHLRAWKGRGSSWHWRHTLHWRVRMQLD